jgi:hypothetical protein
VFQKVRDLIKEKVKVLLKEIEWFLSIYAYSSHTSYK